MNKVFLISFLISFSFQVFGNSGEIANDSLTIFHKTVVWQPSKNNVEGYRIPGIVSTNSGILLAFSEERPLYGDADPKSIVLKRSLDKGKHWSENIYIEKCDGSFWLQNTDTIYYSTEPGKKEVWTNPCPLVDLEKGRVFIFYALSEGKIENKNTQRYTRVFYKTSDDEGKTWSERKEITKLLNAKKDGIPIKDKNGFPCDSLGRAFHMPGPGHGLQLSNGRLLVQVWNRTALKNPKGEDITVAERNYGLCSIYSDDHGKTWKYGSAFGHDGLTMNESRMVELSNGDVYINSRYVKTDSCIKNNFRLVGISHDFGKTWKNIHVDKNFPCSNPCDAGLVTLSQNRKQYLLYSKNESPTGRKNLVIRLSYDEGKSWSITKIVDPGKALYSDMAVLPDNSIVLLYETGKTSPVYCVNFNLEWIIDK